MQGGKNWILQEEMNANRFSSDSHWLEIWSNHLCPSMGPNEGSVAMDSASNLRNKGVNSKATIRKRTHGSMSELPYLRDPLIISIWLCVCVS
jgi:hypothetical protein